MEWLASFSLGFLAATATATGVIYYLSRRYISTQGIFKLLNQSGPQLTHLPGADLVEYTHLGSNYCTLIPTNIDELFNDHTYQLSLSFNEGSKAKFELVPGQWLPGRFVDYHIRRLSVRPISIDNGTLDPVEVFDADVDDSQALIWPTIHRRVAADRDDIRGCRDSCNRLDPIGVFGSMVSAAMSISRDNRTKTEHTDGDGEKSEPDLGDTFGTMANTILSTAGVERNPDLENTLETMANAILSTAGVKRTKTE